MKSIWIKILIAMIVLIVIINYINYRRSQAIYQMQHQPRPTEMLPIFDVKDQKGRILNPVAFRGKNVYIQFVNPIDTEDLLLFKEVYTNFKNEKLELILITEDIEKLLKKLEIDPVRVSIVTENFNNLQHMFSSAKNIGSSFLYDPAGKNVFSGRNNIGYEDGPKMALKKLIRNETFSINDFIPADTSIYSVDWFDQIQSIFANSKKKVSIFSLSVNFCDQCGGGAIISKLRMINSKYSDAVGIYSIIYNPYTPKDLEVLASQAQIGFKLLNAESKFQEKWDTLIQRFNGKSLDNIVFVTDEAGKILSVLHAGCKCFRSFFEITESIIKERCR